MMMNFCDVVYSVNPAENGPDEDQMEDESDYENGDADMEREIKKPEDFCIPPIFKECLDVYNRNVKNVRYFNFEITYLDNSFPKPYGHVIILPLERKFNKCDYYKKYVSLIRIIPHDWLTLYEEICKLDASKIVGIKLEGVLHKNVKNFTDFIYYEEVTDIYVENFAEYMQNKIIDAVSECDLNLSYNETVDKISINKRFYSKDYKNRYSLYTCMYEMWNNVSENNWKNLSLLSQLIILKNYIQDNKLFNVYSMLEKFVKPSIKYIPKKMYFTDDDCNRLFIVMDPKDKKVYLSPMIDLNFCPTNYWRIIPNPYEYENVTSYLIASCFSEDSKQFYVKYDENSNGVVVAQYNVQEHENFIWRNDKTNLYLNSRPCNYFYVNFFLHKNVRQNVHLMGLKNEMQYWLYMDNYFTMVDDIQTAVSLGYMDSCNAGRKGIDIVHIKVKNVDKNLDIGFHTNDNGIITFDVCEGIKDAFIQVPVGKSGKIFQFIHYKSGYVSSWVFLCVFIYFFFTVLHCILMLSATKFS